MLEKYYPYEYAQSVFQIDYQKLYDRGFRGIIFDIDNTLVHHGDSSTLEIDDLFRRIQGIGLKTILLSNNDRERTERFIKNIDTPYICDADKPEPGNYLKAVKLLGIKKEEAVVVGDQIFTDILGANRSKLASILVRFIRLDNEKSIGKRRYLEYAILECWKHNRKYYRRIGDIHIEGADKNMKKKKEKNYSAKSVRLHMKSQNQKRYVSGIYRILQVKKSSVR